MFFHGAIQLLKRSVKNSYNYC